MNTQDINQEAQLPSDYLIDNHKTLERRNDFDEMCEELDALQHEAMHYAFQDGVTVGEINILRQFVNGQLDKEVVQDFLDAYDREIEDNSFRIGDAECKTELYASDLIKC